MRFLILCFFIISSNNIFAEDLAQSGVEAGESVASDAFGIVSGANQSVLETLLVKQAIEKELETAGVDVGTCISASSHEGLFDDVYKNAVSKDSCKDAIAIAASIPSNSCAKPNKKTKFSSKALGSTTAMSSCLENKEQIITDSDITGVQSAVRHCAFAQLKQKEYENNKNKVCSDNSKKAECSKYRKKEYNCKTFIKEVQTYLSQKKAETKKLCKTCNAYLTSGEASKAGFQTAQGLTNAATQLASSLLSAKEKQAVEKSLKDPTCKEQCTESSKRGENALMLCMCATSGCGYGLEEKCKELAGGDEKGDSCEVKLSFLKKDQGLRTGGDYNELLAACKCQEAGMYWTASKKCEAQQDNADNSTSQMAYETDQALTPEGAEDKKEKDKITDLAKADSGNYPAAAGSGAAGAGLSASNLKASEKDKKSKAGLGALSDPRSLGYGRDYGKSSSGGTGANYLMSEIEKEKTKGIAPSNGKSIFDMIHEYYTDGIKANKFLFAKNVRTKTKSKYIRKPQSIKRKSRKR